MAKCEVCGKDVAFGNNVSHSNRKTSRSYKPNVQSVRVKSRSAVKTMNVCTKCLKSGKVERA